MGEDKEGPGLTEHAISALHAWIGDHLAESNNPLHQPMAFFAANLPLSIDGLALEQPKLAVLVHGLGCNEALWNFPAKHAGGSYADLLQARLGFDALRVRYNTGQRISDNGRQLDALLESLWQVHGDQLEELLLIGHSMGGLVIRSACHLASERQARWPEVVRRVFYLGSPHHGAPLEKLTNVATHVLDLADTTATRVIRDLLNTRSAGVKDLRYGNLVDGDWLEYDPDELLNNRRVPIPWLRTARHHRIVGRTLPWLGDTVVPVGSASATGDAVQHAAPDAADVVVLAGLDHLSLARHPEVYEHIERWVIDDG